VRTRILVATNDETFTQSLVSTYLAAGCDVVTGAANLYYRSAAFDLIHLHWPEELIGWRMPDAAALERLRDALSWWRTRCGIVATVHNLRPHRQLRHPLDYDLYRIVYEFAGIIGHFSEYSRQRVSFDFPEIPADRHAVHRPFLFPHLLERQVGRAAARRHLKLEAGDFAVLAFGAMRSRAELDLTTAALRRCSAERLKILFAARFDPGTGVGRALHRLRMDMWRRARNARLLTGYIDDAEAATLFEAADVLVVPRFGEHLNSGLVSLAVTFGTPIVAPCYGAYEEHLRASSNELYEPGDAGALARALERIAAKTREVAVASNAALASQWGWDKSVPIYLAARPTQTRSEAAN
jgi:glycosyltransferase involved in cell wall biosynthesis